MCADCVRPLLAGVRLQDSNSAEKAERNGFGPWTQHTHTHTHTHTLSLSLSLSLSLISLFAPVLFWLLSVSVSLFPWSLSLSRVGEFSQFVLRLTSEWVSWSMNGQVNG